MGEPTSEAYEAAAKAQIEAVGQYHPPFTPEELAAQVLMRADRRDVRAAVDAVWPLAEAQVRAKVAAEIRAESLCWCMDSIGRHLVENCARIAEGKGVET